MPTRVKCDKLPGFCMKIIPTFLIAFIFSLKASEFVVGKWCKMFCISFLISVAQVKEEMYKDSIWIKFWSMMSTLYFLVPPSSLSLSLNEWYEIAVEPAIECWSILMEAHAHTVRLKWNSWHHYFGLLRLKCIWFFLKYVFVATIL